MYKRYYTFNANTGVAPSYSIVMSVRVTVRRTPQGHPPLATFTHVPITPTAVSTSIAISRPVSTAWLMVTLPLHLTRARERHIPHDQRTESRDTMQFDT